LRYILAAIQRDSESITLKTEAISTSETPVFTRTTRRLHNNKILHCIENIVGEAPRKGSNGTTLGDPYIGSNGTTLGDPDIVSNGATLGDPFD
jgi:hypothetical protein